MNRQPSMTRRTHKAAPQAATGRRCPACGGEQSVEFYSFNGAPVHTVLLMPTREAALGYPKGSISLRFCKTCGFIWNRAYKQGLQEYSDRCEETQGYSAAYNDFARGLAADLIERHGLRGKRIVEIGCGKGEFLAELCRQGNNSGTGFDPAYVHGRVRDAGGIRFIRDFYSEKYSSCAGDFLVCKMTLEHIGPAASFISTIRRSIGKRSVTVFIQVPDAARILRELAFWDVYYEHCSYLSAGSLARLFRAGGFDVLNIRRDYGEQYLMIEARPAKTAPCPALPSEEGPEELGAGVRFFSESVGQKITFWRQKLREFSKTGYRTVLWGSGSKGAAFLTTLGISDEIRYVVDVNPFRKGTFMVGTGHEIVSPGFLAEYKPDAVILMNPVYRDEVGYEIRRMRLSAEVMTV